MRILLINDYLSRIGGAEIFTLRLKEVLEKRGHIVRVLGSTEKENRKSFFSRWFSLKWYRKTKEVIKEFNPEIVHVHNCGHVVSPSVIKASLNSKVPTILSVHDYHYVCTKSWATDKEGNFCKCWSSVKNTVFTKCLGSKKRRFSFLVHILKVLRLMIHRQVLRDKRLKIICASKFLSESMNKSLGVNVSVIPFGFDMPKSSTSYKKKILFMGRVSPENGLQEVIEPLNQVVNGFEVLVAGDGPLREELESKYKNINFLGWQSNPSKFLDECMISVAPALWISNHTLGIFEAMSHGLCVMTANRGGTAEQVDHLKTGITFEPYNQKDFSEKLSLLIKNPVLAKKLGLAAREHMKKNHDWKKIIKVYENLYKDTIQKFEN